jgi:hypothetical protein
MADRRGQTLGARLPRPQRARNDGHPGRRHGEIAFGAFRAGLDHAYGSSDVSFDWAGFDEMDEVRGSGSAEILEDGTSLIEFS